VGDRIDLDPGYETVQRLSSENQANKQPSLGPHTVKNVTKYRAYKTTHEQDPLPGSNE
jgi:hypothetical protein